MDIARLPYVNENILEIFSGLIYMYIYSFGNSVHCLFNVKYNLLAYPTNPNYYIYSSTYSFDVYNELCSRALRLYKHRAFRLVDVTLERTSLNASLWRQISLTWFPISLTRFPLWLTPWSRHFRSRYLRVRYRMSHAMTSTPNRHSREKRHVGYRNELPPFPPSLRNRFNNY